MADSKISALAEKTTFGDDDFLAGTQGTEAGDNRKYGREALIQATGGTIDLIVNFQIGMFTSEINNTYFVRPGFVYDVDPIIPTPGVFWFANQPLQNRIQYLSSHMAIVLDNLAADAFLEYSVGSPNSFWYFTDNSGFSNAYTVAFIKL